ncbi:MAG: hypothetical protein P1S46_11775 [bacterium]|nr:hypothetical protein [bacterium]
MKIYSMAIISLALLFQPLSAHAAGPWPEGLKESAQAYIAALQAEQDAIRESSMGELKGVIPMNTFDRESHNCHEAAGQSYRVYGKPRYAGKAEGGYDVRVAFGVFYRQADRVRELMDREWQEGSGSGIRITFEMVNGVWEATSTRELLTMDR